MSENNGWPGKSGIPPNPERDGWYWLQESDREIECARWIAKPFLGDSRGRWEMAGTEGDWEPYEISNWLYIAPALWEPYEISNWLYIAPALTPAEVDARVKEARRDALEEAAQQCEGNFDSEMRGYGDHFAAAIRALGEKE
jgi:hypothetical protein